MCPVHTGYGMLKDKKQHVANETKELKDEWTQLHKKLVNDAQLQDLAIIQYAVNQLDEDSEERTGT